MAKSFGVIIGRFQVPSLHDGHKALIDEVLTKHTSVLVLIGTNPSIKVTRRNPLDYFTRMMMIRAEYPNIDIQPIADMPSDKDWSNSVDKKAIETFGTDVNIVLYGSRDSFIPHYSGQFTTIELDNSKTITGTKVREETSENFRSTEDFRRGVIYAAFSLHKLAYPAVDIAIIRTCSSEDKIKRSIILGRKANDPKNKLRFPGGFVDPEKDECFEQAAKREASEEISCEIDNLRYLGSTKVNDWRYKKEVNKIMTSLFIADYIFGEIKAGDDLAEVIEIPISIVEGKLEINLGNYTMVDFHKPLLDKVITHLKKEYNI